MVLGAHKIIENHVSSMPMNARWPKSKASKAIEGMSDDVEELKS